MCHNMRTQIILCESRADFRTQFIIYEAARSRPSILIAQLLRGLFQFARDNLNARGIVVHVNNLENLTDADATKAEAIFRDLRDTVLLQEGYHWLVVGTSSALRAVVDVHAQLRSVFSLTLALDPLRASELTRLLERPTEK